MEFCTRLLMSADGSATMTVAVLLKVDGSKLLVEAGFVDAGLAGGRLVGAGLDGDVVVGAGVTDAGLPSSLILVASSMPGV